MPTDRYTKTVLTIIALALLWLSLRPSWLRVEAQTKPQKRSLPPPNAVEVQIPGGKKVWAQVVWIANETLNVSGTTSIEGRVETNIAEPIQAEIVGPVQATFNDPLRTSVVGPVQASIVGPLQASIIGTVQVEGSRDYSPKPVIIEGAPRGTAVPIEGSHEYDAKAVKVCGHRSLEAVNVKILDKD